MLFVTKLCLLAALFAVNLGVSNAVNPWRILNSTDYNDQQLEGPPRYLREDQVFDLVDELKNGQEVRYYHGGYAKQDESKCVFFSYYINVPSHWGIHLVAVDKNGTSHRTFWSRSGFSGDIWQTSTLKIHLKQNEILAFAAQTISGTISFTQLQYDVTSGRCGTANYNTDFEADDDNWQAVGEKVIRPANEVHMTQRDKVSNSESGRVAFMKHPARIYGKTPLRRTIKCMTFNYNQQHPGLVDGENATVGNIQLRWAGSEILWKSSDKLAWTDKWVQATVPIHLPRGAGHYLTLETFQHSASNETFNSSAVLVDNIQFSEYTCRDEISCFFSDSKCGWVDAYYSELPGYFWNLGNGRAMGKAYINERSEVPLSNAGIYTDFTASGPPGPWFPVEIRSPFLPDSDEYCATIHVLYNRIHAGDVFSLIHMIETADYEEKTVLWQLDTAKAQRLPINNYHADIINVQIPHSLFERRIALSAYSSYSTARMSVKSIKLSHGRCHAELKETTTSASL